MVSRAAHNRNKAKHDQREFATVKPKSIAAELDTVWVGEWREAIEDYFTADPKVGLTLQAAQRLFDVSAETAEKRLRKMAQMGVLHMSAVRKFVEINGAMHSVFSHYEWKIS